MELLTEDIGVEISTVRLAFDSASICLLSNLDMLVVSEVNVVNKGIRVEHIREVSSVKIKPSIERENDANFNPRTAIPPHIIIKPIACWGRVQRTSVGVRYQGCILSGLMKCGELVDG
jgi:hypothetical protein